MIGLKFCFALEVAPSLSEGYKNFTAVWISVCPSNCWCKFKKASNNFFSWAENFSDGIFVGINAIDIHKKLNISLWYIYNSSPSLLPDYKHVSATYIRRSCFQWTHGIMSAFVLVCLFWSHTMLGSTSKAGRDDCNLCHPNYPILIIIMVYANFWILTRSLHWGHKYERKNRVPLQALWWCILLPNRLCERSDL